MKSQANKVQNVIRNVLRGRFFLTDERRKTISSISKPIDPDGIILLAYRSAHEACQKVYESLQTQRNNATVELTLHADDGVMEAYEAALDSIAYLCNLINELCWELGG